MSNPSNLSYTETHEWYSYDEATQIVTVGITDYAQHELGGIVYVNLPEVDDEVSAGDAFAEIESVKAVSEVLCPVDGTVVEINEELLDAPENINQDAFGSWLVRLQVESFTPGMSAEEYDAHIG